jgi:hypothetical protein
MDSTPVDLYMGQDERRHQRVYIGSVGNHLGSDDVL